MWPMRCHYVYDEESKQKVLIPGCMSVAVSGDIRDCVCRTETYKSYENERYNKEVKELREDINYLHQELDRHIKIIEKLKDKK